MGRDFQSFWSSSQAPPKGLRGRRAKKRLAAAGRAALVIGRLHAEAGKKKERQVAGFVRRAFIMYLYLVPMKRHEKRV